MRIFSLVVFCLLSNMGCVYSAQEDNLATELPALHSRLVQFYSLEKEKEWNKTYEFHTNLYKSVIGKAQYVSTMKEDDKGWRLIDFDIKNYMRKGSKVILRIDFTENPPKEFFEKIGAPTAVNTFVNEETVIWVHENNEWYIYDAGTRSRFSVNTPIDNR
ncbi:MAG: hypothetical protein ACQETD_09310 [Pseudomonadota bacterium]